MMFYDEDDRLMLHQIMQAWCFSNNQGDLEERKKLLLQCVDYMDDIIRVKREDPDLFLEMKKEHFGEFWRDEYKKYL